MTNWEWRMKRGRSEVGSRRSEVGGRRSEIGREPRVTGVGRRASERKARKGRRRECAEAFKVAGEGQGMTAESHGYARGGNLAGFRKTDPHPFSARHS